MGIVSKVREAVTVTKPAGPPYTGTPLTGMTGMYGQYNPDPNQTFDEGVLAAHGNPLAAGHADYGQLDPGSLPYSGTSYGIDGNLVGDDVSPFTFPSDVLDHTPTSHCVTYPRGITQPSWDDEDAAGRIGLQMKLVHGVDLGGPRKYNGNDPAGREEPADYTTDRYEAPNGYVLAANVPGQLRSMAGGTFTGGGAYGQGQADTVQGYGKLNENPEFQAGHSIRRVQHNTLHFDHTNTHGEQDVPFYPQIAGVAQARFDGPDSPYFQAGAIDGAQVMMRSGGASYPTAYVAPPDPTIVPSAPSPDVWAY